MADHDPKSPERIPDHEARLRERHRRPTIRASSVHSQPTMPPPPPATRDDATAPRLDLGPHQRKPESMRVRSFRAHALAQVAAEQGLPRDLLLLLEAVLNGSRDAELAEELGTDQLGLRHLESRFLLRTGRSVYVVAVEVVNRAARLRREAFG